MNRVQEVDGEKFQAMTGRLRVSKTFLDVDSTASEAPRLRRSLSEGCLASPSPAGSVQDEITTYYEQLTAKLEGLTYQGLSPTFFQEPPQGAAKVDASSGGSTAACSVSGSPSSTARPGPSDAEAATPRASESAASVGTYGHPELCTRPCLLMIRGSCPHGEACYYCHLPHSKRNVSLDRCQRDWANALSAEGLLDLLEPLLRSRCQAVGVEAVDQILADAMCRCRALLGLAGRGGVGARARGQQPRGLLSRQLRSLKITLGQMELKGLLVCTSRLLRGRSDEAGELFRKALLHLRLAVGNAAAGAAEDQ